MKAITLSDVMANESIAIMIEQANACLEAMGYTDHGPRHVGYVSRITRQILHDLDFDERTVELGAIAGWVHDVGNAINRDMHAQTGATLLMPLLREMGMPFHEVMRICIAVGNHDERSGCPVSEISAALIVADKIDAHRARVRRTKYDFDDIHDRVNYSIRNTQVTIDGEARVIRFACTMDNSSSVKEFLNIYMSRMTLSEAASKFLGCRFEFVVNRMLINNAPVRPVQPPMPPNGSGQEILL